MALHRASANTISMHVGARRHLASETSFLHSPFCTCAATMLRGQRSRRSCSRLRLHHAATLFIACLALAHLLITYWTIQYEEVWAGLSPSQKLLRAVKVLLVDAYMPRTKVKSSSCQVADHIPKVRIADLSVVMAILSVQAESAVDQNHVSASKQGMNCTKHLRAITAQLPWDGHAPMPLLYGGAPGSRKLLI